MYKVSKAMPTSIERNTSVEGETIETRIERLMTNNEGIDDGVEVIYTERKDGVLPEYDPRTDKFEIAIEAGEKIANGFKTGRVYEAKMRAEKGGEEPKIDGKPESTHGKDSTGTTDSK